MYVLTYVRTAVVPNAVGALLSSGASAIDSLDSIQRLDSFDSNSDRNKHFYVQIIFVDLSTIFVDKSTNCRQNCRLVDKFCRQLSEPASRKPSDTTKTDLRPSPAADPLVAIERKRPPCLGTGLPQPPARPEPRPLPSYPRFRAPVSSRSSRGGSSNASKDFPCPSFTVKIARFLP